MWTVCCTYDSILSRYRRGCPIDRIVSIVTNLESFAAQIQIACVFSRCSSAQKKSGQIPVLEDGTDQVEESPLLVGHVLRVKKDPETMPNVPATKDVSRHVINKRSYPVYFGVPSGVRETRNDALRHALRIKRQQRSQALGHTLRIKKSQGDMMYRHALRVKKMLNGVAPSEQASAEEEDDALLLMEAMEPYMKREISRSHILRAI